MYQKGFTLVELMVGLVIAMLCMIMMLMLFKQTTQIGISSAQDAEYDAQIQTGLLVAQKYIQNAGYGSGLSNDIVLDTSVTSPGLYWRFIPEIDQTPITYKCQGIQEKVTLNSDQTTYNHQLVLKTKTCNATNTWQTGTWSDEQVIVSMRSRVQTPIFQFSIASGKCTPYGIDKLNSRGFKQITITANREYLTGTGGSIKNTLCLNNILVA